MNADHTADGINESAREFANQLDKDILGNFQGKQVIICGPGCNDGCTANDGVSCHAEECWLERRRLWQRALIQDLFVAPIVLEDIFTKQQLTIQHEVEFCRKKSDAILLFLGTLGVSEEFNKFRFDQELIKKMITFVPAKYMTYYSPETSWGPYADSLNEYQVKQRGLLYAYDENNMVNTYETIKRVLKGFFTHQGS